MTLEVTRLSATVVAVTGDGGICPGYALSQPASRPATLLCICSIVPREATTRASNRSARTPAVNQ